MTSPCDPIAIDSKFQLRNTSSRDFMLGGYATDCFNFFPFLPRQAPTTLYPLRVLLMSLKRIPDEFEDESVRCWTAIHLAYSVIQPWGMNRKDVAHIYILYILSTYIAYICLISYFSGTTKIHPFVFLIFPFLVESPCRKNNR